MFVENLFGDKITVHVTCKYFSRILKGESAFFPGANRDNIESKNQENYCLLQHLLSKI